ncbi:glycosyltransferase [Natronococcus sp. JC468]|uniref:glycosyltransferase n=1 Tax=Natronococcus sp. JC468 TaxID=1961921 RepID=UPI00143927C8|nr:glycosyltransferase [Natronococcus sp. JC468]NKE34919.1 glycosyltransferase [Natronococcus sp. JC468]
MSEPRVSVIVPVYDDPEGLRRTLSSLVDQTVDDYEVVVADNGSTDETPLVARSYRDSRPELLTLVTESEVQGSYAARNAGIRAASDDAEILAFLDADSTVEADWLERAVAAMDAAGCDYMGCRVEILEAPDEGLVGRYNRLSGFPVERYVREQGYAPTTCLLIRREVVDDVGTFDDRLVSGGDLEFGRRVRRAGWELRYEPDAVVFHPPRSTLRELVGKYVRIGRGIEQKRRLHPELEHGRGLADPRQYLPPRPSSVRGELEAVWDGLGASEKLLFYGLRYVLNLAKRLGQFRELRSRR